MMVSYKIFNIFGVAGIGLNGNVFFSITSSFFIFFTSGLRLSWGLFCLSRDGDSDLL